MQDNKYDTAEDIFWRQASKAFATKNLSRSSPSFPLPEAQALSHERSSQSTSNSSVAPRTGAPSPSAAQASSSTPVRALSPVRASSSPTIANLKLDGGSVRYKPYLHAGQTATITIFDNNTGAQTSATCQGSISQAQSTSEVLPSSSSRAHNINIKFPELGGGVDCEVDLEEGQTAIVTIFDVETGRKVTSSFMYE